jgi:hypothetical protein
MRIPNKAIMERLEDLNKDIMKRLDDLEKRNALMSAILLLYSIAIAFVIGYFSTKEISFILLGAMCYVFGGLLTFRHEIRRWFTSRFHHPTPANSTEHL